MAFDIPAIRIPRGSDRIAVAFALPLPLLFTIVDALNDIEILRVTHDNIVATGINGITRLDGDSTRTCAARDLQTADDTRTMQIAIVQPLFGKYILLLAVEIRFGQQLP